MDAWQELSRTEDDRVWSRFRFQPSVDATDWPGIDEPTPSVTYDISAIYVADKDDLLEFCDKTGKKARCTLKNEQRQHNKPAKSANR